MKKKIFALCLVIALAATAVIGGTLAYFTDTDEETNTFTAGGVAINLIEQERDGNGGLRDFTQDKVLMPIVGSIEQRDDHGQPVAENFVDKIVTIKNTGKSDAWVRAYVPIPATLDDGLTEGINPRMNVLHFAYGYANGEETFGKQWLWKNGRVLNYFETTIGGVAYNVYYADYYKVLPVGETTEQLISGFYLDAAVDMNDEGQYTLTRNGVASVIEGFDGSVECPVFAVAVQAAGFDSAAEAIDAAFGPNFNPWAE